MSISNSIGLSLRELRVAFHAFDELIRSEEIQGIRKNVSNTRLKIVARGDPDNVPLLGRPACQELKGKKKKANTKRTHLCTYSHLPFDVFTASDFDLVFFTASSQLSSPQFLRAKTSISCRLVAKVTEKSVARVAVAVAGVVAAAGATAAVSAGCRIVVRVESEVASIAVRPVLLAGGSSHSRFPCRSWSCRCHCRICHRRRRRSRYHCSCSRSCHRSPRSQSHHSLHQNIP